MENATTEHEISNEGQGDQDAKPRMTFANWAPWLAMLLTIVGSGFTCAYFIGGLQEKVRHIEEDQKADKANRQAALDKINAAVTAGARDIQPVGWMTPMAPKICTTGVITPCDYTVGLSDSAERKIMKVDLPKNKKLIGAWWEPVDAIPSLSGFRSISVAVASKDTIDLTLNGSGSKPGVEFRILVLGLYGPE